MHDPGLTILEQLCYGLTDIGYRTSYPVEDLLVKGKDIPVNAAANAFYAPSDIFSSHPVTNTDLRKLIIDRFDEVQNVWIRNLKNEGIQEEASGLIRIEVLPKLRFIRRLYTDRQVRKEFSDRLRLFLNANRNLGEYFTDVCLLEPQPIEIEYNIHLREQADIEQTLATLFLSLFEYIYEPVGFRTNDEMQGEHQATDVMYAGPRLNKGFLPDALNDERVQTIESDILQRLFSKTNGVAKCEVKGIFCDEAGTSKLSVKNNHFFHLMRDGANSDPNTRFENLYKRLKVLINGKEIGILHKDVINNLFFEKWSKKYRSYSMEEFKEGAFNNELEKTFRDPGTYFSIQQHFPLIYNIGPEGLADSEPDEKKGKAAQLKAFLMLFEQHLAGHMAQLSGLGDFFDINFVSDKEPAFQNKWINAVPNWTKLFPDQNIPGSRLQSNKEYLNKKNAVYNHLLARFGEEISEVPWKISARLHLLKSETDYLSAVIKSKSLFLQNIDRLGYNRMKGEHVGTGEISGLEEIICRKTDIPVQNKPLAKSLSEQHARLLHTEENYQNLEQLNTDYRTIRPSELSKVKEEDFKVPPGYFGEIGIKSLFREALNPENYRITRTIQDDQNRFQVIFRKEKGKWVKLYNCENETDAVRFVAQAIDYFVELNHQSEGFYLVDHILLYDMLTESNYGFSFQDEYGENFFFTEPDESWGETGTERHKRLGEFFLFGTDAENYASTNNKWQLLNNEGKIIACTAPLSPDQNSDAGLMAKKVKSYIRFFSSPLGQNGAARYAEMEKIRLMGSIKGMNFGQRRLMFQRKLRNNKVINEDFFDMQVTFLFPDWPVRFQDARFRDFVQDLIHERIPSHLKNNILWIDHNQMQQFETVYQKWEQAKAGANENPDQQELSKLAFDVYEQIQTLKATN
ncbi:MAG: hypothetical protein ACK5M7_20860 [Draconibacterium sp.]